MWKIGDHFIKKNNFAMKIGTLQNTHENEEKINDRKRILQNRNTNSKKESRKYKKP